MMAVEIETLTFEQMWHHLSYIPKDGHEKIFNYITAEKPDWKKVEKQPLEKMGLIRRFLHDILGWHSPDLKIGFDGCSFTSTCKHCGKKILQDSQGNWF